MGRIWYLIIMALVWSLTGVATNAHKGAVFAAVVGFFWMLGLAIGFISTWDVTNSQTPIARVVSLIVFWVSIPIALVAWGNKAVDGGGALQTIFWFAVAALAVRLLALGAWWVNNKWGTN